MPRTGYRSPIAMAVIAVGAMALTCTHFTRPQAVVLITLDTTRADRLPAYGGAVATPGLDRLTLEGTVFERTESVAPLTLTAHTSIFTGLYPPHHGVRDNADAPLDAKYPTLAETLHARGFHTAAFVGSIVLGSNRGLARGFDVYGDGAVQGQTHLRRRPANEVIDDAVTWLEGQKGSSYFLWVHLYDPHAPQAPPDDYRHIYGNDLYAGAIAFMDSQIARLLDRLDLDRTTVIVAGDHGESLGDHGELEHGIFLYEAAVHVPLVIRVPQGRPGRVAGLTSLVDILPTVLDLTEVAIPPVDGISLGPVLSGRRLLPARSVYAESFYARRFGWSPPRMLLDGRFKFIDAPRPELYDLEMDPSESRDLSAARPMLVRGMRAGLDVMFGAPTEPAAAPDPIVDRAAIASLGYVSRAPALGVQVSGLDPKDFIQHYNATTRRRAMQ